METEECIPAKVYKYESSPQQFDSAKHFQGESLLHNVVRDKTSNNEHTELHQCNSSEGLHENLLVHKASKDETRTSDIDHAKRYKCDYCLQQCDSARSLRKHLLIHRISKDKNIDLDVMKSQECMYLQHCEGQALPKTVIKEEPLDSDQVLMYKCKYCSQQCDSAESLWHHMLVHNVTEEKNAGQLGTQTGVTVSKVQQFHPTKSIIKANSLLNTVKDSIAENKTSELDNAKHYKCDYCQCQCDSAQSFKEHLLIHSVDKDKLSDQTKSHKDIKQQNKSAKSLLGSSVLHKVLENKSLKTNNSQHFNCSFCSYHYDSVESLQQHMKIHRVTEDKNSGQAKPQQSVKQQYSTGRSLLGHSLLYTNIKEKPLNSDETKLYKCMYCPHQCESTESLHKHLLVHNVGKHKHLNSDQGKTQTSLTKPVNTARSLLGRSLLHNVVGNKTINSGSSQKKLFSCNYCPHECDSIESLQEHLLIHKVDKDKTINSDQGYPQKCKIKQHDSTKSLLNSSVHGNLNKEKTGNGSKLQMFSCNYCQHQCDSVENLQQHLLIHNKDKTLNSNQGDPKKHFTGNLECDSGRSLLGRSLLDNVAKNKTLSITKPKLFSCNYCPHECDSVESLQEHLLVHNAGKNKSSNSDQIKPQKSLIQCDSTRSLLGRSLLNNSVKNKTLNSGEQKLFTCNYCPHECDSVESLQDHLLIHNVGKDKITDSDRNVLPLKSDLAKSSEGRSLLEGHSLLNTAIKKKPSNSDETTLFTCVHCPHQCDSVESLQEHMLCHDITREKNSDSDKTSPYKCMYCPYESDSVDDFKEHSLIHNVSHDKTSISDQGKLYYCQSCRYQGESVEDYQQHCMNHDLLTEKNLWRCYVCNSLFLSDEDLKQHYVVHTSQKPYQCDICEKQFTSNSGLNMHKLIHTGDKPHVCDTCGKEFTRATVLRRHQRVHTGEKPHRCLECGKYFANLFSLSQHKLIHSGERQHKCEECGKAFRLSNALKRHMLLHTGEKPHECDYCGRCFRQSGQLKQHKCIRYKTPIELFECCDCGEKFTDSDLLYIHMSTHTGLTDD